MTKNAIFKYFYFFYYNFLYVYFKTVKHYSCICNSSFLFILEFYDFSYFEFLELMFMLTNIELFPLLFINEFLDKLTL